MLFEQIISELNKNKVKYLVVGGVAVNFHGFWRSTGDFDIILLLQESNLKNFIKAVKYLKLQPRVPVDIEDFANTRLRNLWIKEKNMKAFALYDPQFQRKYLDVVIDHPVVFKEAYANRQVFKDGKLSVPVISIKDLIRMKKKANRERDKIDIQALKRIEQLKNEKRK